MHLMCSTNETDTLSKLIGMLCKWEIEHFVNTDNISMESELLSLHNMLYERTIHT